ncbi:hypothetical protein [Scytonema sp. NUACC26]|uniref:hypothetical protein n=1 Tax=Scytonema sp. NUACC26 TaxID=3140176 RepID=UPI0034DB996E
MNQNSSVQICNPSLTLFAFHLRNSLSEGSEQVKDKANHLWEQCVELGEQLKINELESLKSKLACYDEKTGIYNSALEEAALEKKYQDKNSSLPLDLLRQENSPILKFRSPTLANIPQRSGEIYPLRIHDTYAVDLTFRYKESVDIAQLSYLNPNGYLLSSWMRPSLGETLLLFAKPLNDRDDYRTLADNCVNAVLPTTTQSLVTCIAQGKLFGGSIFEYENEQEDPTKHYHLWIWFNPDGVKNLPQETTSYLLNLLCCRSKILFAYHQARQGYREARELYSQLETEAQVFNNLSADSDSRLKKLKELLTKLSPIGFRYARLLRDMQDSDQSIITNIENYNRWLQKILQKSLENFSDDDLEFLKTFRDRTSKRLHEQIQTDLNYLSPGRDMFQQAIALCRGLVEIDQAERNKQQEDIEKERDRNFQTTAFAVGAGLTVGGIVISASSQVTDKNPLQIPWSPTASSSPHPFVLWVIGSIVSGLIAAWITWSVTKCWQKHSKDA